MKGEPEIFGEIAVDAARLAQCPSEPCRAAPPSQHTHHATHQRARRYGLVPLFHS